MRLLAFCLRLPLLRVLQRFLFNGVALRQCLGLRLVLLLELLRVAARGRLLRSPFMIGCLCPLELLPLLLLAITEVVLSPLIRLVAFGIARRRCRLVCDRGQFRRMHGRTFFRRRSRTLS